jgi:hypothetical protein
MPRRKPEGWPELMTAKRLASGVTAYYWSPPTRARKAACPVGAEALGTDYGIAKKRCDDVLNPHYRSWLTNGDATETGAAALSRGTFDWLVAVYKTSPKYTKLPADTRDSYDRMLRMVSVLPLKDGRPFGALSLSSITPGAADKLFERIKVNPRGGVRIRTAVLAMTVSKRAWNVARRSEPKAIPLDNPFRKMDLEYKAKTTRLFQHADLEKFVTAADAAGEASIATAAMIAFYWLQREIDIIGRSPGRTIGPSMRQTWRELSTTRPAKSSTFRSTTRMVVRCGQNSCDVSMPVSGMER